MDVILIYDGDFNDINLKEKINQLQKSIADIIETDCEVLKVEPWNSVKVTFSIPSKAAKQLKELARTNSSLLNDLDILSVQIQGEDVIQVAVEQESGNSQPVVYPQNTATVQQNGVHMHAFNPSNMGHVASNITSHLPPQVPAVPKKRSRKSKDKQPSSKSSKLIQSKSTIPTKLMDQTSGSMVMQPNNILSQESPQYSLTQLSPSVEDIVTEAWDQHRQSTEDDIMAIQLQSFTSGTNMSPGNDHSILRSSPFEQHGLQNVITKHQQHITSNPNDIMHSVPQELQKQHSVPNNFAPGQMPLNQNPSVEMNMSSNMNQLAQEAPVFTQQINNQGLNQEISPSPQLNNFQGSTQQITNTQYTSVNHQMHWPANSMIMAQNNSYRIQNTNTYVGQPNQNEISSQSPITHASMMTSPGSVIPSQGNLMLSPSGIMSSQSNMITSPNAMMVSQGSMSPAVASQHQFPFSFSTPTKQQGTFVNMDKMQAMGQNMSKDSPLLVNLLQNEAANNAAGLTSPTQFSAVAPVGQNQKPKRKKPSRKKKPSKSSAGTVAVGAGPMQAMAGMYNIHGQFVPQHYHGELPEQMMQQGKANYPTSKTPVIEAISRSDVGSHTTPYSNETINTSDIQSPNQMPQLRRHNSFPASRSSSSFPPGFDPSKTAMPPKPPSNLSQQQPMYMSQMSSVYPGYKPNQQRAMMIPQQNETARMPYQGSNFQHAPTQIQMMQQQVVRNQRLPPRPVTPAQMQQMQAQNAFQQSTTHPGSTKSSAFPTLHQQRPMQQHQVASFQKRMSFAGKLPNGAVSVMLKSLCLPRCPPAQAHQINRPQSTLARKSPGSSIDSMSSPSPKMSYPSPKINHSNAPSPQVHQPYVINSPSMPAPGSSKAAAQNRPRSRNFVPSKSSPRRPSYEQFGNMTPNSQNRSFFNNNLAGSAVAPNSAAINAHPQPFPFQHINSGNNKLLDGFAPGEIQYDRAGAYTQASINLDANNPALSWHSQATPPSNSAVQAYTPVAVIPQESVKMSEPPSSLYQPHPSPTSSRPEVSYQGVTSSLPATVSQSSLASINTTLAEPPIPSSSG